jgi:hypothetical protein
MKRGEVMKQLRKIAKERNLPIDIDEGSNHTKVWIGTGWVMVPRHNEINENTARGILRDAREV